MKKLSFIAFSILAVTACHRKTDPSRENFTQGMIAYLAERGDLCLGKNTWPIDVTAREFEIGARNAVQMPVLEKLGLVTSTDSTADPGADAGALPVGIKRYQLTDAGRAYYREREAPSRDSSKKEYQGDLCAAKLSLDEVVGWTPPSENDPHHTVVTYTYKIDAAPWTRAPEIKKVFPVVAGLVQGEGTVKLEEAFTLTNDGWVATDILDLHSRALATVAPQPVVSHP